MDPTDGPTDQLASHRGAGDARLAEALALVRYLRAHDPWDAEQTPRSLVPFLLEEAHETVAAIRSGRDDALEEELGDLLLNLAFQIVIGEERVRFDASSVAARLDAKMRRRHPHLFGQGGREGWEAARAREREGSEVDDRSLLGPEETGLPALIDAHRIQQRAAGVGFDWPDAFGALEKLEEEIRELREAMEARLPHTDAAVADELGDVLFAAVNVARLVGAHADDLVHMANRKFRGRFAALEELAHEREIEMSEASLEVLDELWDEVKRRSRGPDPTGQ